MLTARQKEILQILKTEKRASVETLAKRCYVSEMTVRRELSKLSTDGYIERYHGGAVYMEEEANTPILAREVLHKNEKQLLAKSIRRYLHDGMAVYIDSSSTCSYVIPILAEYKDIRIVTNSVYALHKAERAHIPCILTGGEYDEHDMCLTGHIAEQFVGNIYMDIGFFSSHALSDDGQIRDNNERQTSMRKAALKSTAVKIFLFSSEKLHQTGLYSVCARACADQVIVVDKLTAGEAES